MNTKLARFVYKQDSSQSQFLPLYKCRQSEVEMNTQPTLKSKSSYVLKACAIFASPTLCKIYENKKHLLIYVCISFDGKSKLILYSRVRYFKAKLTKLVSCDKGNIFNFFISKQRFGNAYIFQYYKMHYMYFYVVSIVVFFLHLNLNCNGIHHCLEPEVHIK